jgi:predicted transcriptional regulator
MASDEITEKILKVLANADKPLSSAEIGKLSGLPANKISTKLKILAKDELINSPARCKYAVTEKGKKQLPP